MKTEILFGFHSVLEALRAQRRRINEIYTCKKDASPRFAELIKLAESRKISIQTVSAGHLKSISGSDFHQGIGARAEIYPQSSFSEMLKKSDPFLLIADSISDTHNLGALIRTALCAGADGVLIPKDRAAAPVPAVSRASAGALEHIFLMQVTNLSNAIKELRAKGLWIAGMAAQADRSIYESDLRGSLAIVIGGEEKGIRPLVRKQCDFLMSIPQKGPVDSLNASVAGAVVMYEAYRQRGEC
ncbi:MAG: 23S rRNA (guanosine(2251)-2'-O)-methyltransferase RlmB [Desulfococcaceae bacterium]|jgi:23S rRNA (guanosine2251-2'-O)-methyltransferase|nr:23S rRNA (guanosine(2251)-2'-O)-methyltransferase RlmB [Desulfococcaceae bacterium]